MTGMFIKTHNVTPPNSRIKIEFDVENDTIVLEALVMWAKRVPQNLSHLVKKSGMGVRFLNFYKGEAPFKDYFSETLN